MNGHWEVKDGLHPARFWADISRITLMSVGSHELGPSSVGCSWGALTTGTSRHWSRHLACSSGCVLCSFMLSPRGLITATCQQLQHA